jgi:hypothetical protein
MIPACAVLSLAHPLGAREPTPPCHEDTVVGAETVLHTVDFENVALVLVAEFVADKQNRVVVIGPRVDPMRSISFVVAEPSTPDELFAAFVELLGRLGYEVHEDASILLIERTPSEER